MMFFYQLYFVTVIGFVGANKIVLSRKHDIKVFAFDSTKLVLFVLLGLKYIFHYFIAQVI